MSVLANVDVEYETVPGWQCDINVWCYDLCVLKRI